MTNYQENNDNIFHTIFEYKGFKFLNFIQLMCSCGNVSEITTF